MQFLKKMKLGPKLITYFLVLGLLPLILVGILAYQKASSSLYDEAENKLTAIREIKKTQIENYIAEAENRLEALDEDYETFDLYYSLKKIHDKQNVQGHDKYPVNSEEYAKIWEEKGSVLRTFQSLNGYYDVFMICAKHGHVMYSNAKESDLGENLKSGNLKTSGLGKLYHNIIAKEATVFSDFEPYAPSAGEPAAFMGLPFHNESESELLGVIAIQFPLEHINEIMQQRAGMGETGETYLVGSDYLMRSDSYLDPANHTVKASFADPTKGSCKTEAAENALKGEENCKIITDYNGNPVVSAYAPLEFLGNKWAILAEIDKAEALAAAGSLFRTIIIVMLISAGVIVFVSFVISKSIATPISNMAEIASKIADGDLTESISVDSEDEVGILGKALNKMVANLSDIVGNIKKNTTTVASASEELSAVSNQMLSSAEEMVNQSTSVASTTEQMSTNIATMASAAEEMSVNANEVAGAAEQTSANMNTVSSAVEEMSVAIRQIAQDADAARNVADEATESSNTATETMGRLGEAAKEIGNVTEVIKRIAEQTNLLALNATIEAASAGEAGKGFAVVANEIKELANQSAQAADDIAKRIDGVQGNTDEAVTVISKVAEIIDTINKSVSSIAKSVEQQNLTVNEISSNVMQAGNGAQNIARSITEVAKGSNDVSNNSGEAAKGANDVSQNIGGIRKASEDTNKGAQQVNGSAKELAEMAGSLKGLVEKFTV